jgi:hypothetical protein
MEMVRKLPVTGELKFVPVYFPVPPLTATVQTEPRITVLLCILSEDF